MKIKSQRRLTRKSTVYRSRPDASIQSCPTSPKSSIPLSLLRPVPILSYDVASASVSFNMLAFTKLQCLVLALFSHQLQECHLQPGADIGPMSAKVDSANMQLQEVHGTGSSYTQGTLLNQRSFNTSTTIPHSFYIDSMNRYAPTSPFLIILMHSVS